MNISKYIPPQYFSKLKLKHITRDEMNDLCHDENYYKPEIFKQRPDLKNEKTSKINVKGLKYNPNNDWDDVIPAYRWKCVYKITREHISPETPENVIDIVIIGLDIDKSICQKKYAKEGFLHATFLHYDDPDSIYCVLTKTD